jgi:O-antigen ligase
MPKLEKKNFYNYLIIIFPIFFIIGSAAINLILIIISLITLYEIFKKKNYIKSNLILLLLFGILYIYWILIAILAEDSLKSLQSSISQLRFFLFAVFISIFFKPEIFFKYLIQVWSVVILLVCIDTNIQLFTGIDIFGYTAEGHAYDYRVFLNPNVGRLSGPFGDELVVGAFLAKISAPIILFYLYKIQSSTKKFKIIKPVLLLCLVYESVIISGERTSLIIISTVFLIYFIIKTDIKKILLLLFSIFIIISIFYSNHRFIKLRINDTVKIVSNIPSSSYGRIYNSSIVIWKENIILGTGLKNYYINCNKLKDPQPSNKYAYCSPNHSHNTFLQLLSETGLLGLLFFYLFFGYIFKIFYENKKKIKLLKQEYKYFLFGSAIIVIYHLIPSPVPAGSFFSTWNATFFWLQLGLLMTLLNNKNDIDI